MKGPNAAIVEALRAIQKVIIDLSRTISTAAERKADKGDNDTKISAEVRFPESVERERATEQQKQHRTQKFIAGAAWAAFFAAFIYAGIAAIQLMEMHHSLLVDQRAWMGFDEVTDVVFNRDEPLSIKVPLKNVGKTPAQNASGGLEIKYVTRGEKLDFEAIFNQFVEPPNGLFMPGQSLELIIGQEDKNTGKITKDYFDKVSTGEGLFYVFGKVTYTDIFNIQHWTRYCRVSDPKPIGGIKFRQCLENYQGIDPNEE